MLIKKTALLVTAIIMLTSCKSPLTSAPSKALSEGPTIADINQYLEINPMNDEKVIRRSLEVAERSADLNSLITLNANALDDLKVAPIGALYAVPIVVKDNIHVTGLPNTAGTPGLENFVPTANNAVVEKLVDAGAIVIGKANLHELAFGITSDNAHFGSVGNPYNPSMFAGGSSGGTAAAVSAGIVPVGLGTDTGGSARIPAALTGVVGFRPSSDRYPKGAVTPISDTRDTVGIIGRSVADIDAVDRVITDRSRSASKVKPGSLQLGVPRNYFYDNLDAELEVVVEAALKKIEAAGVSLVEVDIPNIAELIAATGFPIALYEVKRDMTRYLELYPTGIGLEGLASKVASPDVQAVMNMVRGDGAVSTEAYEEALRTRESVRALYQRIYEDNRLDGLIFPTTPLPARPIAGSLETVELNGEQVPTFPSYVRNAEPASIAALPGISLPAGLTEGGLPVGLEIDGPEGTDVELLSIALTLEQILEFKPR